MRHEQQDGHDEGGGLVVGGAARDRAELDVLDRNRRDEREHRVGVDACGRGPLPHCDELDGAGDDRPQLLVGLASPLEPASVDDEHVDVAVADGLLAGGDGLVAVHARVDADCVALRSDGARQFGGDGDRSGRCPSCLLPLLEQRRQDDHAGDDDEDHDHRCAEGAGPAALAHLSGRDEPALADAVHAATAWRNSSDSVGGWYANETTSVRLA